MASYGPLKQALGRSRSQQAAPRPHRVNIFLASKRPPLRLPGIWTLKITCFGQVRFPPERFCLKVLSFKAPASLSRVKPTPQPASRHQWLLLGRLNNFLGMLHPAANRHFQGHLDIKMACLWASKFYSGSLCLKVLSFKPLKQPLKPHSCSTSPNH